MSNLISSLKNWGDQYARSSEDRARFYLSWIRQYSPVEGETTIDIGCGSGFFSTGNRFFPIDRHTGLPFIDLLPKRVASAWATKKKGRPYSYTVYEPTFYGLQKRLLKASRKYFIDHSSFMGFYKTVYPKLYHRGLRWFNVAKLLDHIGLLRLVTPKYYVVFRKDTH